MRKLTVLYDGRCGFCVRCRWWLSRQAQLLELEMLERGSGEVGRRFPTLPHIPDPDELVAVGDDGGVYWGARAWLMCLYALEEYREWSLWLASPALLPFARQAFELISKNRLRVSTVMRWRADDHFLARAVRARDVSCPTCV